MDYPTDHRAGMTEDGVPLYGTPQSFYGTGLLAFLDLLGFSSSIRRDWRCSHQAPLARLLRIKDFVLAIRPLRLMAADSEGNLQYEHNCHVRTISDSIAIVTALPSKCSFEQLNIAMMNLIVHVQHAWRTAIAEGYTVRGAIELGSLYWNVAEIVGPALIDCHDIEKGICKSSRVLIGPRCIKALLSVSATIDLKNDPNTPVKFMCTHDDGAISLNPRFLVTHNDADESLVIQRITGMRDACCDSPEKAAKYDPLLQMLIDDSVVRVPTPAELAAYASAFNR